MLKGKPWHQGTVRPNLERRRLLGLLEFLNASGLLALAGLAQFRVFKVQELKLYGSTGL